MQHYINLFEKKFEMRAESKFQRFLGVVTSFHLARTAKIFGQN